MLAHLKRLFYDSCFTGGSGLLQRAGYQSKTLSIILFWLIALLLTQLPILIPFWHTQGGPNTVKDCSKLPVVKVIHWLGRWMPQLLSRKQPQRRPSHKAVSKGMFNKKRMFDNVLDWYITLWIIPEPPVEQKSQKSLFLETPCTLWLGLTIMVKYA